MSRLVPLLLMIPGLLATAGVVRSAGPAVGDRETAAAAERQILVTIRQSPTPPLGRAGTTRKPYGASRRYRVTPRARRTADRLARDYGLRRVDGWPIEALGVHCVVFELPRGVAARELLDRLAGDPRVESAQPMQIFAAAGVRTYDDPYLHLQHGFETTQVRQAHRWAEGRGVTVAVVDSGVDVDHPELAGRISTARDFVRGGSRRPDADLHGTAVAGVIASLGGNGIGIVGVAPGARLMALRACWEEEGGARCTSFTLAKAIAFAVDRRPGVLNLSLSGPPDPLLGRLLEVALDRGIVVVAADDGGGGFPSSTAGVIAVGPAGATGAAGPALAPAPGGRLLAPGEEILTLAPEASYDFFSGSSFAAAHVSGIAALLLELEPRLGPASLLRVLREPADDGGSARGGVRVNACAALARLVPAARCATAPTPGRGS